MIKKVGEKQKRINGKTLVSIFLGIILLSYCFAVYFDNEIIISVSEMRTPLMDLIFLSVTIIYPLILGFLGLVSLFFLIKYKKKNYFKLIISNYIIVLLVEYLLKYAFQRPRPFQTGLVETLPFLESTNALSFSFPSGHALFMFSIIPILSRRYPKFRYLFFLGAGIIAISRVYFGLHYLSDIIIGSALGYGIGLGLVRIYDKKEKTKNTK